jgi:hypothetical protein
MRRYVCITAIGAFALVLLTLASCWKEPVIYTVPDFPEPLATPVGPGVQATFEAAQTQQKNYADEQAVATAVIMRNNAQATMNSANATLYAAQTQDQSYSNVIAAQIAATAEVARANAEATLVSAGSTQSAALTQDAIRQTQVQYDLYVAEVAGTQNAAVANDIATQTQAAVATSQWYADQARQRTEQWQGPLSFLWMWCLPIFIVLVAGLVLWGLWSWLTGQQASQPVVEDQVDEVQAPAIQVIHHRQEELPPGIEGDVVDSRSQLTKPDDQVRHWLDEVKRKLLGKDQKDDHTDQ